ncbi:MAG: KEOPS complex subunit Pcc1 [Candidatus Heimdallarchaeota archaeon]
MPIKAMQIQIQVEVENEETGNTICAALNPDNLVDPPMTISMKYSKKTVKIDLNHVVRIETAISTINDLLLALIVSEEGIMKVEQKLGK